MSDPRYPKGEPRLWTGSPPQSGRMERWRPVQTFNVELVCPDCRRGHLVAAGETHPKGNVHNCTSCTVTWVVPGEPYPRRVERIDTSAQPMTGAIYAE